MSPILKIIVGALMMVLGVFTSITFSSQLVTLILGGLGPLLVLVGAFIVWLESDELKIQREESKKTKDELQRQQTLEQQQNSSEQAKQAAQEIKQAVKAQDAAPDPEEILSGTVREVKEEVSDRGDLDVEELLESERNGKNRKTLVNYLERQID